MATVLHKEFIIERDDYDNAGNASSRIKQTLAQLGVPSPILRRIAVAAYEAEINMIIHAWGGKITVDVDDTGKIRIEFRDPGPGIPDLSKALTPGWSTASPKARELGFGAGMGLPNIKRVSDDFDIKSSPEGTILTLGFNAL